MSAVTNLLMIAPRHVAELGYCHPILIEILALVVKQWPHRLPYITSIHRTHAENIKAKAKSEIHVVGPPYRSIDVAGKTLTWTQVAKLADYINARYEYDTHRPGRFNVAVRAKHGTGVHLHLQVTARTRKKSITGKDERFEA